MLVAVDELQVVPIDYERMLRELRKYGGGFLLCTQEFGSLEAKLPGVRSLFFGNAAGLLCFRVAEAEGRLLAGELDERVTPLDLANLERGVCVAKLGAGGRPVPAFSLRVHPPLAGDPALAADLWRASARRHGLPVGRGRRAGRRAGRRGRPSWRAAPSTGGRGPTRRCSRHGPPPTSPTADRRPRRARSRRAPSAAVARRGGAPAAAHARVAARAGRAVAAGRRPRHRIDRG